MSATNDTKQQAKLLAVKVQCPNGHLIYESQPQFYVYPNGEMDFIHIQVSCESCDIDERFFTLTIKGE